MPLPDLYLVGAPKAGTTTVARWLSAHPDVYWVADPDSVWETGKHVVELIEAGAFPFDGTGCDYRPNPQWTVPTELPAGWDRSRGW